MTSVAQIISPWNLPVPEVKLKYMTPNMHNVYHVINLELVINQGHNI